MILCNSCLYQFDTRHCCVPDFGEVVQRNGYVDKKTFINVLQNVKVMLFLITFLLILVEVLELYIIL